MTVRGSDERLTFDDAARDWLAHQDPVVIGDFLEGAHWLMKELDTRIHVAAEQGYDTTDLRISMQLLDLPRKAPAL